VRSTDRDTGPTRACARRLCCVCVADVSVHCGQICESKGLVSIDRREITALLSTTPRLKPRSSTNDLAPQHCTVRYRFGHPTPTSAPESDRIAVAWPPRAPKSVGPRISLPPNVEALNYRHIFGRDSDLEAFSHNPSDGSFAPLAYQPST
jgi:hypothetical protein